MQTLKWSRQEVESEFAGYSNLNDVISHLEEKVWSQGEVICEIYINGMFISEKDESRIGSSDLAEIDTLEVRSQNPDDLVGETIGSIVEWIPKIRETSVQVAELIREGDENSRRYLTQVLDGCQWFTDALALLKNILIKMSDDEEFEKKWTSAEEKFSEVLRETLEAFQNGDMVLLSDLLEYEFSNTLDMWLELFQSEDKIIARSQN